MRKEIKRWKKLEKKLVKCSLERNLDLKSMGEGRRKLKDTDEKILFQYIQRHWNDNLLLSKNNFIKFAKQQYPTKNFGSKWFSNYCKRWNISAQVKRCVTKQQVYIYIYSNSYIFIL